MTSRNGTAARKGGDPLWAKRFLGTSALTAVALLALASPARADDVYWDANGAAVGSGGTGNWDLTSSLWSQSNSDVLGPFVAWSNNPANPNNAIFGVSAGGVTTTVGTVTLTQPITAHNLTFQSVNNWILAGGTLTLGGINPTITTSGTTTINSVIAGTAGLTKAGTSILSLGGTNSFSGGIVINAGTLTAATDAALGAAGNNIATAAGAAVTFGLTSGTTSRSIVIGTGGTLNLSGAGAGSALISGTGNVNVGVGVTMSNDANSYDGVTRFSACNGVCSTSFTSIGNLGEASSLGAPTTVTNGTIIWSQSSQYTDNLIYLGDGDDSDRNWVFNANTTGTFINNGSGTLDLSGDFAITGAARFVAQNADFDLSGVLSGGAVTFSSAAGRQITVSGLNTFTGIATLQTGLVNAASLANGGVASALGAGTQINLSAGILDYTGAGGSSDRTFLSDGVAGIRNSGTGALTLSGPLSFLSGGLGSDTLIFGGDYAGANEFSGVISGTGALGSTGSSLWRLSGANMRTGAITIDGGTLQAGNASAFGKVTAVTVNGGTLDLNGYDLTAPQLSGTGGSVALNGGATLTVSGLTATNNTTYGGSITGNGSLLKRGTNVLTLTGQSSYSGGTTIQGGTIALDFSAAAAPADNILSPVSSLTMAGGTLSITGAAGEVNSQSFTGLNVTAGTNRIVVASGSGGTMNVNLGTLNNSGGLMDFTLPASGTITATNPDGALGWATINGTDYAQVSGGVIGAFTNYVNKDAASTWLTGDVVSDAGGAANTAYSGTVSGSQQLGGLQYTAAQNSVVTIGAGNTLGIDGTIIVSSSVGATSKEFNGAGSLTGAVGGGTLGFLHNGTGNFLVTAQVVDNGGDAVGVTKAGTGRVSLNNVNNSYTGATTLSGGTLSVASIGNGGAASAIGASSADASNLVLESGTLSYTGGTATSDRGFTLVNGGSSRIFEITNGAANLTFIGLVTSPDDAGLTKIGGGTLTLANAANDYSGITRVENGVLAAAVLADGGQLSSIGQSSSEAANLVLLNGGTLRYTGATVGTDRGVTLENGAGRIDVANAATNLTVSGPIVGAGRLEKYGDGTLVLTGANTYSGITVVNAGTLRAGAALASGATTGVFGTVASLMTVNAGGTLDLADNSNQIGALNGGGNVTLGSLAGTTLTIGGSNSGDPGFTGAISGAGSVIHTTGAQVMTGCNNSYTGSTSLIGNGSLSTDCIRDGGLASGIGASSSDAANLVLQTGGILNYTAVATNQTSDRGFTLASGSGIIQITDAATSLTFSGAAVGTGNIIKRGAGTLILAGDNSYSGITAIDAGRLVAGSATAFDQGMGVLQLANVAGATFDLNGFDASFLQLQGGGANGGTVDLGSGNATLTLSNNGNNSYGGTIVGTGNLVKLGGATQILTGCASTYDGMTAIRAGVLQVSCLANGGAASSIGASGSDAGNLLLDGGTLRYSGTGDSSDRLFTLGASTTSALEAAGTGAIIFTNTGPIAFSSPNTAQRMTLGGISTADNILAARITDNGTGKTAISKTGVGTWILTNQANSYTGTTTISGGVLGVDKLANGGVASSIGQSSSAAANLIIGTGATLRYTGSGDTTDRQFTLGVGTTAIESVGSGAVVFSNTGAVSYSGNGARVVSLGGTNTGANIMGATIGNQGANVTSLAKNGSGTWILTGNNSFSGSTVINDGNLVIGNGGTSGNAGTGNVNVTQATSTLSFNRSDAFNFTGTISGPGAITQIGSGTTILTAINSIGAARVDDGILQVNGTLQSATFVMNGDGALTVNGTVEGAVAGTAAIFTGDAGASAISVNAGGVLRASGDLGGGADVLVLAGLLDTGGAPLNLGAGDDRLTLNDGGAISGTVDGGAGTDTLIVNNAVARTIDGARVTGFEALTKQNAGTLTLTGDHGYGAGTTISSGILSIGNGGTSGTLTGNIVNNGQLQFNRSDTTSFAGNISGTGSLTKLGAGVLTLTGDATHTGGTLISQGSLSIGDGGTTGSISGDIVNEGLLAFNRSDATSYSGSISGTGSVKTGSGIVSLTANSSWSGGTTIGDNSELRIAAGNVVTSGGSTIINRGALTVTGAGSTFEAGSVNAVSASGNAIINVTNGGTLKTSTLALRAAGSPSNGQLNISGAGSLVDLTGALSVAASATNNVASITISDGGTLRSTGENLFGSPIGNTTDPIMTISGTGSNWTSTGNLVMRDGSISLLNGGTATFDGAQIGTVNAQAQMLVSGAGSTLTTTNDLQVGTLFSGKGVLTVVDGGRVSVGGTLAIGASAAATSGAVNIGAAAGSAAAAAGVLDAAAITFGPGSATLNFNHTDSGYALASAMSGNGAINQLAGVTRLTGNSAGFTGLTSVSGGTLLVDGALGSATSVANVLTGGTLGGSGTIGGNVLVADGGVLAPGSNGVGALTIGGNLSLASNAAMNFQFGQANAPGSPLNDVVNVGGDLALDGTLNVTVSPGGSFDIGLYRVINYAGTLTDGGLAIGTLPAGVDASDLSIQTAIAGQVNLINANGATLNFWDGVAGPKFNAAVNGGDGVWQNSSGNDNWTDQTGTVNAAFSDSAVAIFSAAPGTVTVDNSLGAVSVGGMQFASDGYRITGDAVTLANAQSVIRVGDGTAAGAGYGATIDSMLAGSGVQLVKTDLGTLTLGGANSYDGGTLVTGGTLRIAADGNLGSVFGILTLDGGALSTSASFSSNRLVMLAGAGSILTDAGTTLTLNGPILGTGALTKGGAGTLVLAGPGVYGGGTTIAEGTLRLGDGGVSGGILGDVLNNGMLAFDRSDVASFGGLVSGTGRLDQLGSGTTILTGANSYSGGTLIGAGTLQIGDGGTTGSILGDVVANGTLAFNRADEIVFAGLISGTGGLNQIGAGTTILTGANSYVGATNVTAGTLLVNGDQSAATGLTTVISGATLGGTGTIGGDVALADGAIFTPGDATGPGTLTINGALGLSSGTRLVYDFGQSDVVGGPLNDLTQIGGDLVLDGTIDVAVSAGGSFDVGLYRVMSYGGTLTDNGLDLGILPSGTLAAVQTSVAGQVNLINATGTTLNFWDGAAGPKSNGIVNGGDGIWQNSGGNDNWTEISGSINAAFSDNAFAIFVGAPGTVTVDDSLGAVSASGLQFASDGYVIGGDSIALVGPQSVIRVGDGTAAGLGTSATIDAALTGNTQLVKTDLGTLILNGINSYTGGTRLNVGTLQIASDANLGDAAGGISFDGGTLHSTASITSERNVDMIGTGTILTDAGTTLVFNGSVTGSGDLIKDGAGNLALNDTSDYTGLTIVRAGGLFVNGDQSAATGLVDVAAGALLGGRGIIGGDVSVADGGTLAPGNSPGTLTINGNLALSSGSSLAFEFGEANVAGGALNDLVNVGGDLVLDGTLNVAVSVGGTFGGGVYRVFNYGGTLTDNGLELGTVPVGSELSVQTAIGGQVNLVNTAGLTLNFWDGQVGPKNSGTIDGGNGIWRVAGGNNNWTESAGQVNADYAQNSFAIFAGAPGVVSVDNSGGAVESAGMQFAVDGYTLAGDALTLTGLQAIIRVGDGTAAGADYTATIANALTGAATLVKTDGGTLVLGGINSYSGGTAIEGGTLRISSDANLGDAAGALSFDGGTLNTTLDLSSARTVNLVGIGTLLTDAGTVLTLTGALAGNGGLVKTGAGTLALNGTGGHGGGTNVVAGTLWVNGDYSAMTGLTSIASGASLGGTGTIGGDVALADGAILTPGAGAPGTLTIGGDLSLSAGTRLAYEFGQAGFAGGALNDLVNVGGDFTLDGIIDVTVPAAGAFDVGVYRVFNYGGALTNNGLTLGNMPLGSDVTVQTSITGQVNLVNSAGLMLNFWDGTAGPKNNGAVNGGTGLWQNSGGNDNWTDASGSVNAAYQDGGFAIFAGTGGAVSVDNSLGQVTASGMQFAATGYTIGGGALELTGSTPIVRVGDGSTAGAGFTATIDAALTGDTQLVKSDAGTLILGAVNSYTSGTLINGGTAQVSTDANLGAAAGAVTLDGGTLATSANLGSVRDVVLTGGGTIATMTGTSFTYGGLFSGTGALTKAGAGTLLVSGDSSGYTALTTVAAGTLALNGVLGGTVDVQAGARLEGSGIAGGLINRGVVAPGSGIGSFTVNGDYQGVGGVLEIEAELGGDDSPTDRLVVNGATSGTTQVQLTNRGGLGAQTVEGIKIVDVTGASAGSFTLKGDYVFEGQQAVIAGAYGYRLYQGGVSTPADGDWYLRSALVDGAGQPQGPLYQPGVPVYESYGQTLQALNVLATMQERVGNRQWAQSPDGVPTGIWGRMESSRLRPSDHHSTTGADANIDSWKAQIGFDHMLSEGQDSVLVAGLTAHYGEADASVRSRFGSGTIDTKGYGLGATLTWFGTDGFYADAQAQWSWFDSKLKSVTLGTLADDNHGKGEAVSLELGKSSVVGQGLTLTPQIQMAYQNVSFDAFTDPFDARVSSRKGDSLKTRWGISIDHRKSWDTNGVSRTSHVYGLINLSYEWLDGTRVDVSGASIANGHDRLWGEVALGGTLGLTDRLSLYAQGSAGASLRAFGDSYSFKGVAGVKLSF